MQLDQELLKNLNGAIDAAIKELATIDTLAKSDVSLQDAKLRPESANGTLPGHEGGAVSDSVLKPEDAKKAEAAAKAEAKDPAVDPDKAKKADNPFADKDGDKKDDDKDDKKDKKAPPKKDDDGDADDMDDDKAEKMKAKIKKYEDEKAAKAASSQPSMTKADVEKATDTLRKSIVSHVEEVMQKTFGDRLTQLEGLIQKLVSAPVARTSVSGLAPLAKSGDDVQPADVKPTLNKAEVLDKLFALQKADDKRVDSTVITRVEMNDFTVLAERGINLK